MERKIELLRWLDARKRRKELERREMPVGPSRDCLKTEVKEIEAIMDFVKETLKEVLMDWAELQSDVTLWATKNFGDGPAWQPMLGLIEEVGEYYAAENSLWAKDEMVDALGDQCIYVLNLCEKVGVNFGRDIATQEPCKLTAKELMGCLALSSRAILKHSQAIRNFTWEVRRDHLLTSLGMWYRWASYEAAARTTTPLLEITQQIWANVRKRDWVKDPATAHKVAGV